MSPKTQSWLSQICAVIGLIVVLWMLHKIDLDAIAAIVAIFGVPTTIWNLVQEARMSEPYIKLSHEENRGGGKSALDLLDETPVFCDRTTTQQENLESYRRDLERERAAAYYREIEEKGR